MDSNFPYSLYSKFNSASNDEPRQQSSSYQSNSSNSLDKGVSNIARKIAEVVIKSGNDEEDDDHPHSTSVKILHIPVEILLFSAVIVSKVLLFAAYREAKKHGLEILDL